MPNAPDARTLPRQSRIVVLFFEFATLEEFATPRMIHDATNAWRSRDGISTPVGTMSLIVQGSSAGARRQRLGPTPRTVSWPLPFVRALRGGS
jgi:hypothetical protein